MKCLLASPRKTTKLPLQVIRGLQPKQLAQTLQNLHGSYGICSFLMKPLASRHNFRGILAGLRDADRSYEDGYNVKCLACT